MAYDHRTKAGNRGDVWKHAVLVALADRIDAGTSFTYVETHSGAPVHTLNPRGEWRHGIGAVLGGPGSATPYIELAKAYLDSGRYPAGWQFFVSRACQRMNFVNAHLFDIDPAVAAYYARPLGDLTDSSNVDVHFTCADGFGAIPNLQNADLVFLDPPYSPIAGADWVSLAHACNALAARRIPFVAWYPFSWPARPDKLVKATGAIGWEVHWATCGPKPSQNLKGCGMLVSNQIRHLVESARRELTDTAKRMEATLTVRG